MKRSANYDKLLIQGDNSFQTQPLEEELYSEDWLFWSTPYERGNKGCVERHLAKSDSFKARVYHCAAALALD